MSFSSDEIIKLVSEKEPSNSLKQLCSGAILHQLGHVFGLVHERDAAAFKRVKLDCEAVISDYSIKVWDEFRGRKNPNNHEKMLEMAQKAAESNYLSPTLADSNNFGSLDSKSIMIQTLQYQWLEDEDDLAAKPLLQQNSFLS